MKKTGKTKSTAARKPAGKTTAKATSAPVRRPGSENAIIIVSGKPKQTLRRIASRIR